MEEDEKRIKNLRELSALFSDLLSKSHRQEKTPHKDGTASKQSKNKPKQRDKMRQQGKKNKQSGKAERNNPSRSTKKKSTSSTPVELNVRSIRPKVKTSPTVKARPPSQIKIDRHQLETIDIRGVINTAKGFERANPTDHADISSRLSAPVDNLTVKNPGSALTDLVLGLDIGSTSSKVVIRLPYSGTAAAQPVPAPSCLQADEHPYYWKTILWQSADGQFSLLPVEGFEAVSTLKVDLLSAYKNAEDRQQAELRLTAYAALMIRQAFGWYVRTYPRQARSGNFYISINVGFPAASLERDGIQERFRRCCQVAGELALSTGEITMQTVSSMILSSGYAREDEEPLVEVYPELSGAIAGFIHSSTSRTGTYLLADVGGLTLDCILFSLRKDGDNPYYAVYAADICRYGAQVVEFWISQGNSSDRAVAALGNFYAETIKAAQKKIGWRVMDRNGSNTPTLPTLMIGGGRKSAVHRTAPGWTTQSLKNWRYAVSLSLEDLAPSRSDIDAPLLMERSIGRLLVAGGLSLPRMDIPTWIKSSDVPDAEPLVMRDYSERFVGAEQT